MNKIVISGRLTKDPQIFTFEEGAKKATFSLAVKNPAKDSVSFIPVKAWDKLVNYVTYLHQGDYVELSGYLRQETFATESGENRSVLVVYVQTIERIININPKEETKNIDEKGELTNERKNSKISKKLSRKKNKAL